MEATLYGAERSTAISGARIAATVQRRSAEAEGGTMEVDASELTRARNLQFIQVYSFEAHVSSTRTDTAPYPLNTTRAVQHPR